MQLVISLAYWETIGLIFCAFGMVFVAAVSGNLKLDGLFYGTTRNGRKYFSPERVQLFVFTLAVAFQYMSASLRDPRDFPNVPSSWIALLGGSHFVYISGKTVAAFLGRK